MVSRPAPSIVPPAYSSVPLLGLVSSSNFELPESSISRRRPSKTTDLRPTLKHSLLAESKPHQQPFGVLCVAVSNEYIFSGSQGSSINVFERSNYQQRPSLKGHEASVSVLSVVEDRGWLISGSGDGTIRIWCLSSLQPLLIIQPRLPGNIFSLLFSSSTSTLYIGCQSTTIQWVHLPDAFFTPSSPTRTTHTTHAPTDTTSLSTHASLSSSSTPPLATSQPSKPKSSSSPSSSSHLNKPSSKFFDSYKPTPLPSRTGKPQPDVDEPNNGGQGAKEVKVLGIKEGCEIKAAWGYIYALAWLEDGGGSGRNWLISGSGGGDVKIWEVLSGGGLILLTVFEESFEAILSVSISETTLYAGTQDGGIKVFDLETRSQIRFIVGHESSVLSLSRYGSDLYSTSADGRVIRWNSSFDCVASLQAHRGPILSSVVSPSGEDDEVELFTGGNDGSLHVWSVKREVVKPIGEEPSLNDQETDVQGDVLLYTLSKLISYPSVPNQAHREDCRQAAMFLKRTFTQLGATSSLLPGASGKNPLVLATFKGKEPDGARPKKKRVLFYGHYDVVQVSPERWTNDPFTMVGRNGYLYGRGIADNKGPILAIATAASALLESRSLDVDLVMLIEGEEEAGSDGFRDAVRENKEALGDIDCILVSNSFWIDEVRPCLTYGLRGVVHVSLEISSGKPDLHSGVEGGGAAEPMIDMVNLISTVTNPQDHRIQVPSFYDYVRPLSKTDQAVYARLAELTGRTAANLSARFSEPSFSVGSITAGSSGSSTVIPSRVKAGVSFRIVPDQDLDTIVSDIVRFLELKFEGLQSQNEIKISVPRTANYWLGDLSSPEFLLMEKCVSQVWNIPQTEVLRIREGGSIPSIPFLEQEFSAPAIHLPMGQSSDNAHLEDERLRLLNLLNGRQVFRRFLEDLGKPA